MRLLLLLLTLTGCGRACEIDECGRVCQGGMAEYRADGTCVCNAPDGGAGRG